MAKILAPNKQYNGVSATVSFSNGVGETNAPYLLEWFKENGYEVEQETEQEDSQEVEQETEQAQEKPQKKRK